jgi:plastocyanin
VIAGVTGFAAGVVPTRAADQSVSLSGVAFSPKTITVAVGDTVHWQNAGGTHNVRFAGETGMPATPTSSIDFNLANVQKTFTTAGTFKYYCEAHASDENDADGMTGTVVVGDGGATPTPSPSPTPAPVTFTASVANQAFCVRKGDGCRHLGVRIAVDASRRTPFTGRVKRGRKAVGRVRFTAPEGESTFRFRRVDGALLKSGDYTITLAAGEGEKTLGFAVR